MFFKEWCIENDKMEYLDMWDYELNDKTPDSVFPHSRYKAFFKCRNNHKPFKKELQVLTRDKTIDCPICKSFGQWCLDNDHQDYIVLWDHKLNMCSPFDISYGDGEKYYFKCPRGIHESTQKHITSIRHDLQKTCIGCNSFGQYLLDEFGENAIDKYWSSKNIINPFEISKSSRTEVYILCQSKEEHIDYVISCAAFTRGNRCPVCSNKKIIKGINDIATTHPHIVKYFVNKEDTYNYSHGSTKKVKTICPHCNSIKTTKISSISNETYSCDICSDGISYPEKFVLSVLKSININVIKETSSLVFSWSDKWRYDFYLPDISCIIEVHGMQHYDGSFEGYGGRTLEEEQANDVIKRELALSNGIKHYIELDCRKSDMEWIKQSIMGSELPNLLWFKEEDIDWLKRNTSALSSNVLEACRLWNNGMRDVKSISNEIGIHFSNITKHLKRCATVGLCDYDPKIEKNKGLPNLKDNSKKVKVLSDDKIYNSLTELSDISMEVYGVKFDRARISLVCRGKQKHHKGYVFKFVE